MTANTQEYRSESLEKTLRKLHLAVSGVKASVIVNFDGLLVSAFPAFDDENYDEHPTSSPQVAAMSATLVGLAQRTLRRLAQGELERLMMFAEAGVMIVYPAGEAMLAVLVDKETKPGMLLYAASRACDEIKEILGFGEKNRPS